ncbi:GTP-binding protein 10 isoform X3 [Odocoileus virginianus]
MGYPRLGGEGGKGGDVWVVAHNKMTLKQLKDKYPQKRFVAGEGANSRVSALKGSKGKDCEIPVPVGVSVTDENGKVIGELNKEKDRILVAEGGLGGKLLTNFLPLKGQKRVIHLDLKLIADIGLVGFPNAGKSSLLSKISHAKPAIADYAFTTIKPELGKIMYSDFKQISVADLPGLIEGAHMNKGMGHKFLKHIERTKQLLFVVDISGFQLSSQTHYRTAFETIILLSKELELYKEELQTKPALLAVNKMDLPDAQDKFHVLMNQLQNPKGKPVHSFSASLMNICFCFIDYAKAFDYVDHNKLWKILKEMGIPDHLTCLLRNLYAGQEATVRTGHGTTDWFQIGKGVRQVYILSPCLFNLYAEYLMRNAGLEETQAGIKIAGRNINNLRYVDDTTLMAESEEELKSLLMKVKEGSEKVGLKLNIQKIKIMASCPITSWEIDGETVADFIFGGSKITAGADCSHEIKRRLLLGRKVMTHLDSILKNRDITLPTKVRLVKAMVFPVVMYECNSWTMKKAEH